MVTEDSKKKIEMFKRLVDQIHMAMGIRGLQVLNLTALVKTINDSMRGHFHSHGK